MTKTYCVSTLNGHRMKRRAWGLARGPLLALLAVCFALPAPARAETMKIGGTGAALGTIRILADAFEDQRPGVAVEVFPGVGSDGGVRGVARGMFTLGVVSRPLDDDERALGVREIAYARTPLVVATRGGRGRERLSSRELTEIFAGRRTDWTDGTRIRLILRPRATTEARLLDESIPGMPAAQAAARRLPGIPVAYSDQEALDAAEAIDGALTTATLAAIRSENRSLVPVAIDGVAPDLENVANGSYPMVETLYFVTGPEVSPLAEAFMRFVRSARGAAVLRDNGQVALPAEDD